MSIFSFAASSISSSTLAWWGWQPQESAGSNGVASTALSFSSIMMRRRIFGLIFMKTELD
jgi:hypothetical protein